MRKHEGCIWIIICWLLFKCKIFEILLIEFVLLVSFYNLPILAFHIKSLYKIEQRNLFGQVLASFIELVGYAYWLCSR